jgi:MerR family transcriptional regulator, heat shock protein HspR
MNISPDEPVFEISVVARIVGVHQQTLRSYERLGLVAPQRTRGNTRLYSQQDIARLQQVRRLVNELGINVSGVEVILRMSRQIEELQAELAEVRRETAALRQRLGER